MTDYFDDDSMGADFGGDARDVFGADFGGRGGPKLEDVFVGIPQTVFGGAGRQVIQCNVTQPFRADRLILDAASRAAGVTIEQISVSSKDQNRGDGALPASMFTPDATHRLSGSIVDPGVGISLTVVTTGALTFGGCFFGPAMPKASVVTGVGSLDGVACGIPPVSIGIGATETLLMNPTQPFLASHLVLDAAGQTPGVLVNQISISSEDQNRAGGLGVAPGEIFTPDATHKLRGTPVTPGVPARISITNTTAGVLVVGGAFFGKAHTG